MKEPRFELEQFHEDALGLRTTGWVLLAFAGLLWIFLFISFRDGTVLFPAWAALQSLLGFVLIGIGMSKENQTALIEARMAPAVMRTE
jgi:hypothetical protein